MAANGQEAMLSYQLNRDSIQLVLLDLVMPDMGGQAVANLLRDINPELAILYCTGYEYHDVLAHDVVKKPFSVSRLSCAIRQQLEP
ncbi:MAG: response regulator [Mariprofundaceae bacterium]|nr:response regulator [Mariprofundaceae bacterium]